MNERIKQLRAELNLSQRQLAKYLGITNTAVSKIENGENKLSEQNIIIICTTFNVNEEWLRTGEGNIFIGNRYPYKSINERMKVLRFSLDLNQEQFGSRLGVTAGGISKIESSHRSVTEQMILSICREFNVNEEWFRIGVGEMFNTTTITPDTTINYRERIIGAISVMPLADLIDVWEYIIKKD